MKIILSHPTGNQNVRAVLQNLEKENLLTEFNTTIHVGEDSHWLKLLPNQIKNEFLRRAFPVKKSKIWGDPYRELARLLLPKLGWKKATLPEHGWASTYNVYRAFDKAVANRLKTNKIYKGVTAVYAYEDGALETFKEAKKLGLTCIYDLPIAYWQTVRSLLEKEAERLPAWADTIGGGIKDSAIKLERKTKELELADIVITPSRFVANSLPKDQNIKPVVLSPFGSPAQPLENKIKEKLDSRPLRVLFVGSMGQRKGLADLFNAIKLLNTNSIELIVLGSLQAPMSFYKNELSNFTYEPGRPHREVLQLMQTCDVFCLPSIAEGRALVLQEAMSQGLPLIITPNTGGEDLIVENKTGFLVPTASPEAIAEKLNWFLDNRSKIPEMGQCARVHAATYTWQKYATTIVNSLLN